MPIEERMRQSTRDVSRSVERSTNKGRAVRNAFFCGGGGGESEAASLAAAEIYRGVVRGEKHCCCVLEKKRGLQNGRDTHQRVRHERTATKACRENARTLVYVHGTASARGEVMCSANAFS